MLNNIWGIIIILILLYLIYNKIYSLDKQYDKKELIDEYQNQLKLQKKINILNHLKA